MFMTWLLAQTDRNDPIGDLARDFRDDKTRPSGNTNPKKIRRHMEWRGACLEALEVFDDALKEYQSSK